MPASAQPFEQPNPRTRDNTPDPRGVRHLVTRRIKASGWSRLGRLGAALVSVICLAAMSVVRGDAQGDLGAIAVRTLGWASWLVALPLTLGAITSLAALRDDQQLNSTLRALGFAKSQVEAHTLWSCIRVVLSQLGVPGVGGFALALVLSRDWHEVPARALQLAAAATYVGALACAAGLVAAAACRLGAKPGRRVTLLFLLGPMLVSDRFLHLANLPRALSQILDGIARLGAA